MVVEQPPSTAQQQLKMTLTTTVVVVVLAPSLMTLYSTACLQQLPAARLAAWHVPTGPACWASLHMTACPMRWEPEHAASGSLHTQVLHTQCLWRLRRLSRMLSVQPAHLPCVRVGVCGLPPLLRFVLRSCLSWRLLMRARGLAPFKCCSTSSSNSTHRYERGGACRNSEQLQVCCMATSTCPFTMLAMCMSCHHHHAYVCLCCAVL